MTGAPVHPHANPELERLYQDDTQDDMRATLTPAPDLPTVVPHPTGASDARSAARVVTGGRERDPAGQRHLDHSPEASCPATFTQHVRAAYRSMQAAIDRGASDVLLGDAQVAMRRVGGVLDRARKDGQP